MCEILRKFDIDSLYICPPYLYTITTLPWVIQKSHFSTVLLIETSDYYIISEETNCNCCTAAYLFTYCCLLLPVICVALFYGQFLSLWSVIFKANNANAQSALFRVTNIWRTHGQRINWCWNIAENFNRMSRAHERYRQTDDRRTADDI